MPPSTSASAASPASTTPASYRCTECAESLCSVCAKTHALKVSENRETGESKSHDAVSLCRLAIEAAAAVAAAAGEGAAATGQEEESSSTETKSEVLDSSDVVVDVSASDQYSEIKEKAQQIPRSHQRTTPLPKSFQLVNNQLICPSHDYRVLDLYCLTCETGICHLCADRSHFEHDLGKMKCLP